MLKDAIILKGIKSLFGRKVSSQSNRGRCFYHVLKRFIAGCAESSLLCWAFSVVQSGGKPSLWCVHSSLQLLSHCGAQALGTQASVVQRTGSRAQSQHTGLVLCSMCDHPGSGIKPMLLEVAGRFFTTEPPGKPIYIYKTLLGYIMSDCCDNVGTL